MSKIFNDKNFTAEATWWCSLLANRVLGKYDFNNEPVRKVDIYQMMDTWVQSGGQKFWQSAASN